MAEIKLDNDQLNAALHAAILTAIGETGREAIIKSAVAHLTTAPSSSYDKRGSPLLDVIHNAAREIASACLKEQLASDTEFLAQVKRLYTDATTRMFNVENREKLVEKLSSTMADALTKDRY